MKRRILTLMTAAALLCPLTACSTKLSLPKFGKAEADTSSETTTKKTETFSEETTEALSEEATEALSEEMTEETSEEPDGKTSSDPDGKGIDISIPDGKDISIDLNAGIPDSEGFSWAAGIPSWVYMPENSVKIEDFSKITGGWKAYMVSDPENKRDSGCSDYFNINISGTEAASIVTFKWHIRTFNADMDSIDVSGEDSTFSGRFKDGAIYATGGGNVNLTDFRYDDETGREYAVGTFMWPDGVEACIGLVRP